MSGYSLLPELYPFMDVISEREPITGMAVAGLLDNFSAPWLAARAGDNAFGKSLLTPGGYPVEFNFRSDDQAICYTAEPGLPEDPPSKKLDFIRSLFNDPNRKITNPVALFTGQADQRFGSWVSVRHSGHELAYKLYHEVTENSAAYFISKLYESIPQLPAEIKFKPMLIGWVPDDEEISEYYFKLLYADQRVLHKLLLIAGMSGQLPFLLSCLSWLFSRQTSKLFENLSLGISFRVAKGKLPSLTFFVHCPQVFTSNALARKQILSLVQQTGGRMDIYEAITARLEQVNVPHPVHSVLSIKLKPDQNISCSVGLSPW